MNKTIVILCSFPLYLFGGLQDQDGDLQNSVYYGWVKKDDIRTFGTVTFYDDEEINNHLTNLFKQAKGLTPDYIKERAARRKKLSINLAEIFDRNRNTLLHQIALVGGKSETAKYLINDLGLNPAQPNAEGKTAGQIALELKHLQLAEALGIVVNPQPAPYDNPLSGNPEKPISLTKFLTLRTGLIGTLIGLAGIYFWRRSTKREIAQAA